MPDNSGQRLRRPERALSAEAAAAVLGALPSEWAVLTDVRLPGRTAPGLHLAVGPQGVFVIDTRPLPGLLRRDELNEAGVRQHVVVGVASAAFTVGRLCTLVPPSQIHPVLCFVGREVEPSAAGDVLLCSTRNLLGLLTSYPEVLELDEISLIALELDASLG